MDYKVTFNDDSPYLQHYGVLGMKWGVRHDKKPSGKRDVSKGVGLTESEQKAFDESIAAHEKHREVANAVGKKMNDKTFQRQDLKDLKKASVKDLYAIEKYAKKTGQMSKDGKAYIRARKTQSVVVPAHHTMVVGGGTAATVALGLGHPEVAMAIGAGTALATLGTSALNYRVSDIKANTANQYHNDLLLANKKRTPIEAYK